MDRLALVLAGRTDLNSAQAQQNEELQQLVADYHEWKLCTIMHIDPLKLDEYPSDLVQRWMMYLSSEQRAPMYEVPSEGG